MTHKDLPSEIRKQAVDYLSASAKAVLGGVPFAGSLLVELLGNVIPNQRMDRIARFAAALENRIGVLEGADIRSDLSDESFNEIIEESLHQAVRSTSQERINYLASLAANSLSNDEISNSEHRHLLRILGEISDVEVIWLRSLVSSCIGKPDSFRTTHESTLKPVSAYLGSTQAELDKHALQESYMIHLATLGLVKRALKLDRNKSPELNATTKDFVYGSPSITPLGRILLRTIGLAPESTENG